jgi:rhodanese-related sulfurtransferase
MSQPTRRYHVPSALRRSTLRVEPDAAQKLLAAGALLIDVRRHDDPTAPLENAVRIPPDELPARIGEFARDDPIVLACT